MRELTLRGVVQRTLALGLAMFLATTAVAQDRSQVIVVNKALHYFAERLLGDAAEVVFPVPEGADPSFWRPSIADISMIQSADLILLNGAGFATWIDRVSLPRSRIVNTSATIEDQFIVTESITHTHGDGGELSHEGIASYIWLDPMLAIAQAEAIAAAVMSRDLAAEQDVEARLAELRSELTALDAMARAALSSLEGTAILATHPRYQYFARRYSLSISSIEWDAGALPSQDDLADMERLSTELDARILIWEAKPPQAAFELTEALGLHSVVFEPGASQGPPVSLFDAYRQAVSGLSEAAMQSSD